LPPRTNQIHLSWSGRRRSGDARCCRFGLRQGAGGDAFNGVYDGRPAIVAHVYGTEPVPTSFTLRFVPSEGSGELGTTLKASLADVTGEAGYITELSLDLGATRGARSYLSAGCPAPEGFGSATFDFVRATFDFGNTRLTSTLARSCKVRR
jgi:hypothetical protein